MGENQAQIIIATRDEPREKEAISGFLSEKMELRTIFLSDLNQLALHSSSRLTKILLLDANFHQPTSDVLAELSDLEDLIIVVMSSLPLIEAKRQEFLELGAFEVCVGLFTMSDIKKVAARLEGLWAPQGFLKERLSESPEPADFVPKRPEINWKGSFPEGQFYNLGFERTFLKRRPTWTELRSLKLTDTGNDLGDLVKRSQEALKELCKALPKSRLDLVSVMPDLPKTVSSKECRLLLSSDEGLRFSSKFSNAEFPELRYSMATGMGVFINDLSKEKENNNPHLEKSSRSMACFPVYDEKKALYGYLRGQFPLKTCPSLHEFSEDLSGFSESFHKLLPRLEFYSRIYGGDSALYD